MTAYVIYFPPGPQNLDPDQTSNRINNLEALDARQILLKHLSLNKKNETHCLGIAINDPFPLGTA